MSRVYFTDRDLGKRFPAILREAGISVERHDDHFAPDTADEQWLATIGASGWIALTHDQRIRYKANERDAVMRNGVAMIVLIGKAPYSVLAQSFVSSIARIEAFVERNRPPFIAKLFRPSAGELAADGNAPGRIELWLSEAEWRAYRGGR